MYLLQQHPGGVRVVLEAAALPGLLRCVVLIDRQIHFALAERDLERGPPLGGGQAAVCSNRATATLSTLHTSSFGAPTWATTPRPLYAQSHEALS